MRGYRGRADNHSGNSCYLTGLSGYLQGLLYPPSSQRSWATSPSGGSSGGSGQAPWFVPSLRVVCVARVCVVVVGSGASRHECPPQALAPRTDFTKLDLEWDSSWHGVSVAPRPARPFVPKAEPHGNSLCRYCMYWLGTVRWSPLASAQDRMDCHSGCGTQQLGTLQRVTSGLHLAGPADVTVKAIATPGGAGQEHPRGSYRLQVRQSARGLSGRLR
jgi:hypothetical protein